MSSTIDDIKAGLATYEWAEVTSRHDGHEAVFRMLQDALQLDGVRVSFTALQAQRAADALDAVLPTAKLLDLRYQQSTVAVPPLPKHYPGGTGMSGPAAVREHSARVDAAVAAREGIISNVGKHWIVDARVTPKRAVLYGWHVPYHDGNSWRGIKVHPAASVADLRVVQPVSAAHGHQHHDYSMTLMLVDGDCEVDGQARRTADVLTDPALCGLAVAAARPLSSARLPGPQHVAAKPAREPAQRRPLVRRGARGHSVRVLQALLINAGFSLEPYGADGHFGALTDRVVRMYQASRGLTVDGAVGPQTWQALESSAAVVGGRHAAPTGLPPEPSFPPLANNDARSATFGRFRYVAAPTAGNPEAIRITDDWAHKNIVSVEVPQLAAIPGVVYQGRRVGRGPANGRVSCHRMIADQLKALWQAWEDESLLHHVVTWAGLWSPRFIRGSRTTLSNHAFGSAFDINAPWNGLGATPAAPGQRGSVAELVPLAHQHGFYWGGHFSQRPDGMHFEVAQL